MKTFIKIEYEGHDLYLNTANIVWADHRPPNLSLLMSHGRYYNFSGKLADDALSTLGDLIFAELREQAEVIEAAPQESADNAA